MDAWPVEPYEPGPALETALKRLDEREPRMAATVRVLLQDRDLLRDELQLAFARVRSLEWDLADARTRSSNPE